MKRWKVVVTGVLVLALAVGCTDKDTTPAPILGEPAMATPGE